MGTLERRAHHGGVARAVKGVVEPPGGAADELLLHGLLALARVERVGRPELERRPELVRVRIDRPDALSARSLGSLNAREADRSQTKDTHSGAWLDGGRLTHGA